LADRLADLLAGLGFLRLSSYERSGVPRGGELHVVGQGVDSHDGKTMTMPTVRSDMPFGDDVLSYERERDDLLAGMSTDEATQAQKDAKWLLNLFEHDTPVSWILVGPDLPTPDQLP